MNRLHNLLDSLKLHVYASGGSGVTYAQLDEVADWAEAEGRKAVCFYLGERTIPRKINAGVTIKDLAGDGEIIPELVKLPYPVCWFEMDLCFEADGKRVCAGLLIRSQPDGGYLGQLWHHAGSGWAFTGAVFGREGGTNWKIRKSLDTNTDTWKLLQLGAVQKFLTALHCSNVERLEHKPDAKLQKARAKRGKMPLFSYWTLVIKSNVQACGEKLGGTHSSPRLHLRRGHPRQYAPGKWTWVQACAVGKAEAGVVVKDYSVSGGWL